MKHVHRIVGADGVERLYLRKAGLPRIRLSHPWGSEDLRHEVEALISAARPSAPPSTLRAALRAYELESADFRDLAKSTQYIYRLLLKELDEDFGALPVSTFKAPYLLQLRNTWAERGYRAANLRLQVLKNVLWPAIIAGKIGDGDPFTLIPQARRPRDAPDPHLIWPEEVLLKVIARALREGRHGVARGIAIGRYAGARRDDIVRITRAARSAGRFTFITGKRRVAVSMPEDPALAVVLDSTPSNGLVLVTNLSGLPYTANGFALEVRKLVRAMAAANEIPSATYDIHGLRHTFGVEAALSGCTDAEGAALMGHGSPNSFATYRRQADRIRLSSSASEKIAALRERSGNGDLENELEKICKSAPVKAAKPRAKVAVRSAT